MKLLALFYTDGNKVLFSKIISVDSYGAKGDGETDDTIAIQDALDSISNGGVIFFPYGIYKISSPLTIYSNQIIELNGSTILQGAQINNLMMAYCTKYIGSYNGSHDIIIRNGIFDGGDYEENNTLLAFCHSKNIKIINCVFKNAYGAWHNIEINSSRNVLIDKCFFDGSRKTNYNGCMIQIDSFSNNATFPWGNGLIDGTVSYMVEISKCYFGNNTISPAIGNHSVDIVNYINIHDCIFDGLTSSRGAINFQGANNVNCHNNTFVNCNKIITVSSNGSNVFNNNYVNNATTICDGYVIDFNNTIDGVSTAPSTAVATSSSNGFMSATDKLHLDEVYNDYSSALVALGVIDNV